MLFEIKKIVKNKPYLYAVVPDHPNASKHGYVLAHRVIMENHIGRLLRSDEIVHHIDHNKDNNSVENLQIMTASEHGKLHARSGIILNLICANCGKEFSRKGNQRASVKGYKMAFCSRSCNGKYQRRKQMSDEETLD